jgi:hypothetical protein
MNRNSGVSGGFGYANGAIGYTWNNNSAATYGFNSGLIPPTNIWSFVALVVEPARATVYMLNDSGMSSATNVLAHNSDVFGNNWQIGRDNNANADDGSRTFIGDIDEVAVFTYSMTPTQIQNLYLSVGTLPVTLTIQTVGSSAVVTWPSGTLLEAPTPNGPWTTNSAPSPYSFTPNAAQKYFKVRVR